MNMAEQLYKSGDTVKDGKQTLECVSVAYVEKNGVPEDYTYNFRLKESVDSDREKTKKEHARVDKINAEREKRSKK